MKIGDVVLVKAKDSFTRQVTVVAVADSGVYVAPGDYGKRYAFYYNDQVQTILRNERKTK